MPQQTSHAQRNRSKRVRKPDAQVADAISDIGSSLEDLFKDKTIAHQCLESYAALLVLGPATSESHLGKMLDRKPPEITEMKRELERSGLVIRASKSTLSGSEQSLWMLLNPRILFEEAKSLRQARDDIDHKTSQELDKISSTLDKYQKIWDKNFGTQDFGFEKSDRPLVIEIEGWDETFALGHICDWIVKLRKLYRDGDRLDGKEISIFTPQARLLRNRVLRDLLMESLDGLDARCRIFVGSDLNDREIRDITAFLEQGRRSSFRNMKIQVYQLPGLPDSSSFPLSNFVRALVLGDSLGLIWLNRHQGEHKYFGSIFLRDHKVGTRMIESLKANFDWLSGDEPFHREDPICRKIYPASPARALMLEKH